MDPSYPNFIQDLDDSQDYSNFQGYENSFQTSNPFQTSNQFHVPENINTSQNTGKNPRGDKWDVDEDIALMSTYCLVSEDEIRGKNQKMTSLWARVKEQYDANRDENPQKIGIRNIAQMKGRYKRLNESVGKWVGVYREAKRLNRSGTSNKDLESAAHKLYEASGSKFNDIVVFNEVMCKHEKWAIDSQRDTTRPRPEYEVSNEDSGHSTKRSRTTEEGDYCVASDPETPTSGGSTIKRPLGRQVSKRKGKGMASNEIASELRALRLTRDNEVEVMKQILDLDQQREQKIDEREITKMQLVHLNTLLLKESLSPDEENLKRFLMSKFYGN